MPENSLKLQKLLKNIDRVYPHGLYFFRTRHFFVDFDKMLYYKMYVLLITYLLFMHSKSAVGRMFDVSCNAVIKWCKKYNI